MAVITRLWYDGWSMRELGIHKIEVHVAGVCVARTPDGALRVLALRRATSKQLFPGLWEGVGGQVLAGEALEEAVFRHLRDEAGLVSDAAVPFATYVIEPGTGSGAGARIPGVRFVATVPLQEPKLDPRQHVDARWLSVDQLGEVEWIPGVAEQVVEGLSTVLGHGDPS